MSWEKIKKSWKKIWYFIWEDDSGWSWIANIILAFVLIKYIVYPGLGLLMGTSYPIVAVVSTSMEHPGTFDEWWQSPASCNKEMCTQADFYANYNITREQFESFRFKNGFNMGDIMVLHGVKPKDVQQGDVIVFKSNRPDPIIHRVIKTQEINGVYHFTTKGDHNKNIHPGIAESDIREDRLIGKALIRVPLLGWIKIGFMRLVQMLGVVLK